MKSAVLDKSTLRFLKELAANNDRDWFNKNKSRYLVAHQNMISFADALIVEMNKHDKIENESGKKSLYRIYADVRFRKDKSPYNTHFSFSLQRATSLLRGGYYLKIKPGDSYLSCGFFGPNAEDLARIRSDIFYNYKEWKKVLSSRKIKNTFEALTGDQVATAPRGYSQEHPAIELLRLKQFILRHRFTDKEVSDESFLKNVNNVFKSVRPYFDYMSEVLTTNANGESLI